MLIDTHCHLDLIHADSASVMSAARDNKVGAVIVPAVSDKRFKYLIELNRQIPQCHYAFGIHPMAVDQVDMQAMTTLQQHLAQYSPVAVGEIGLDYYVSKSNVARQKVFFKQQLQLAQTFSLPVILHVRSAIDDIIHMLKATPVVGGVAHAFNGSFQQAEQLINLGFKLGFGGAMTFNRAKKIRKLAQSLPLSTIVLETDSPDMPPAWLDQSSQNTPSQLYRIAQVLADLREESFDEIASQTTENAQLIFPNLNNSFV